MTTVGQRTTSKSGKGQTCRKTLRLSERVNHDSRFVFLIRTCIRIMTQGILQIFIILHLY